MPGTFLTSFAGFRRAAAIGGGGNLDILGRRKKLYSSASRRHFRSFGAHVLVAGVAHAAHHLQPHRPGMSLLPLRGLKVTFAVAAQSAC